MTRDEARQLLTEAAAKPAVRCSGCLACRAAEAAEQGARAIALLQELLRTPAPEFDEAARRGVAEFFA